jgi:translation initiation factor 3 subunit A
MAPSNYYHKPELALRRAVELQNIHQADAALELLHDVLSSRRHRTWSLVYEQIMITYIDLCCLSNKSREVKDGLHQYRNLCQLNAPGSLEKVIVYLLHKAEAACHEAYVETKQEVSDVDVVVEVNPVVDDDAEDGFVASPQAILLSTISTADPIQLQHRDSTTLLLQPSLKFLWEIYRAILDILRSNSKLEHVYHTAAQGALKFCRLYHRKMEFRHLCEMLRMHLGNLRQFGSLAPEDNDEAGGNKSSKVRGWEGWTAESIELYLQTRFVQLETASALHRYTEGFRTVEDIYNILQISQARRKMHPELPPPKAKLMAAYYEKLTTLFWVSENHLFHGFAWYKYYTLCKEFNRSMSDEMKRMQASAVLLAALCIPPTPQNSRPVQAKHGIRSTTEDDIVKQKMSRMATLLGFHTRNPTREALLLEIHSKDVLSQVPQYLRDLYFLLEETSDPLIMVDQAKPLLEQLEQEVGATTSTEMENPNVTDTTLGRYVEPLTHVLLLKLIVNLSLAYHTVSIEQLKSLTAGLSLPFEQVEKSLVQFTQTKTLSVRIDHRAGCLRFGEADLEAERAQLTILAQQLYRVQPVLTPISDNTAHRLSERRALFEKIRQNVDAEHAANLERKLFIEKKKEEAEKLVQEKLKEDLCLKAEEEALRKAEEERRLARELRMREQDKHKKIQLELENQEKKRVLVAMGKKMDEITEEEMAKIDTEALQKEHQAKINKEKEEAERKTKEAAKKLDYH